MDPWASPRPTCSPRLPCTRRDGPGFVWRHRWRHEAPLHAQGWTLVEGHDLRDEGGSPARAGMDPRRPCATCRPSRLPCTRRDGPVVRHTNGRVLKAPLHAQGWTPQDLAREHQVGGSPARAGMDPGSRSRACWGSRLPCTRRDGPLDGANLVEANLAPLHAQGWTLPRACGGDRRRGSPARAGMDPRDKVASLLIARLPCTRRDGPRELRRELDGSQAPLHAQGWTLCRCLAAHMTRGSPARAGMDPSTKHRATPAHRLPCTRRDGPNARCARLVRAGAPLHAQGWTRRRRCPGRMGRGSPARAGMDRCQRPKARPRARLPCTRRDGPASNHVARVAAVAPLHAQGWTLSRLAHLSDGFGSPARAGMDPRSGCGPPAAPRLPCTRRDGPS
jgi:hypothetical protein